MLEEQRLLNAIYMAGIVVILFLLMNMAFQTKAKTEGFSSGAKAPLVEMIVIDPKGQCKFVSLGEGRQLLEHLRRDLLLLSSKPKVPIVAPFTAKAYPIYDAQIAKSKADEERRKIMVQQTLEALRNFNAINNIELDPMFCERRYFMGPGDEVEKERILTDIKRKKRMINDLSDDESNDVQLGALIAETEKGIALIDTREGVKGSKPRTERGWALPAMPTIQTNPFDRLPILDLRPINEWLTPTHLNLL